MVQRQGLQRRSLKPQISPLRFAPSKIILGGLLCQRLCSPTLATHPSKLRLPGLGTQGWGTLDLLEVWIQNRRQSRVPHIWRALCARCGKPQISPLRFAPVEMTKLGVIADQSFLNLIFIPLSGPQTHEHSLENHLAEPRCPICGPPRFVSGHSFSCAARVQTLTGFSPCLPLLYPGAKAQIFSNSAARLKPCPDTKPGRKFTHFSS